MNMTPRRTPNDARNLSLPNAETSRQLDLVHFTSGVEASNLANNVIGEPRAGMGHSGPAEAATAAFGVHITDVVGVGSLEQVRPLDTPANIAVMESVRFWPSVVMQPPSDSMRSKVASAGYSDLSIAVFIDRPSPYAARCWQSNVTGCEPYRGQREQSRTNVVQGERLVRELTFARAASPRTPLNEASNRKQGAAMRARLGKLDRHHISFGCGVIPPGCFQQSRGYFDGEFYHG